MNPRGPFGPYSLSRGAPSTELGHLSEDAGMLSVGSRTRGVECDGGGRGVVSQDMAEGGGFEPPEACTSTVFKTVAFVRSAIPP